MTYGQQTRLRTPAGVPLRIGRGWVKVHSPSRWRSGVDQDVRRTWAGLEEEQLRYNDRAVRGITDYTLAKRAGIAEFRRGGLTRLDICDAQPELMRAARNIGRSLKRT